MLKNLLTLFKIRILSNKKIIVIALTEHIGDIVACEPVSFYLRKKYPGDYIVWIVNSDYKDLLAGNKNLDNLLTVNNLGEWINIKPLLDKVKVFDLHLDKKPCAQTGLVLSNPNQFNIDIHNYYNYGNILRAFSMVSGLDLPNIAPKLHFDNRIKISHKLPDNYIVIHAVSNEVARCWLPQSWDELVRQLLIEYPDIIIIEIGLKNIINLKSSQYLNCCGKLTFQECAAIIEKAVYYIGVDSAFAHFANSYKVNSAILMGRYRNFEMCMPYSGFFYENKEKNIINYNGLLKDLPVATVLTFIKNNISFETPKPDANTGV